MKLATLGSGSKGNATLVQTGTTRILIDCGVATRTLAARLRAVGTSLNEIDAVLVTHEHTDHVSGLPSLIEAIRRFGRVLPVYATDGTNMMTRWDGVEKVVHEIEPGTPFDLGDLRIYPVSIPHDCAAGVGFCLRDRTHRIGVFTDLGYLPGGAIAKFRSCDLVMVEANYDPQMMSVSPYPDSVRRRIMSMNGHMSNEHVRELLAREITSATQHVVLAHLSRTTNSEALVKAMATESAPVGCSVHVAPAAEPMVIAL